ncbi:glycoside hydrolase family 5 protein [Sphingomonas sp. LB3N6]|uniref:glycoside hydrolase family 5 protein n=1 Tax=Sphingomonas fucosidasi TaxID=3096164 RepID=UPI002FCC8C9A
MTLYPALLGSFQPHKVYLPRWIYRRETPILTSEGDLVALLLFLNNYVVGSQIMHWMTGGGSLAGAGNWERSWHDVFDEELERYGCTYQRLSSSTIPAASGTLSGLIIIGAGYKGETFRFVNRSRRNRRTNATNADGTPGYREMQFLLTNQGAAGTPERDRNGTGQIVGGNLVRVLDTSRTPTGTPALRLRLLDSAGNPSPTTLFEGDSFTVRIETANIIPGTKLKMYPAEDGRKAIRPAFRNELRRAGEAAGCTVFLPRYDPKNPVGYYDGGEITFTDAYDDARPIELQFSIETNAIEETTRDLHFISILTAEGDAAEFDAIRSRGDWATGTGYRRGDWVTYLVDGGRYIYTDETTTSGHTPNDTVYWRPYVVTQTTSLNLTLQIKDVPPRFWEISAKVVSDTIVYAVQAPINAVGDSVALGSTGAPAGFDAAMAAACTNESAAVLSGGRLIAQAGGTVTFSVPLSGSGRHALRLSARQGASPIVIADACAFLTPPALPADPGYVVGVNIAGGEFGDVYDSAGNHRAYGSAYVYPSQPELADPGKRHQEMDFFWSQGVRIIRVPVKWERLQPELFGPLYGDGSTGSWSGRQDMRRLDEAIGYEESLGGIVLLDLHNYMTYRFPDGTTEKVGYDSARVTTEALADFWVRIAERYAGRAVWFGIMNEPSGDRQTPIRVASTMQAVVNAVRARTGATNKILVAGARYSSAKDWVALGQAAAFAGFHDPADNFAYEPHCYFDNDASGTTAVCTPGSRSRLDAVMDWADSVGAKIFVGELGAPEGCGEIIAAYQAMSNRRSAVLGWTTWAAGRFWKTDYMFRLGDGTPSLAMLAPFLAPTT